MVNNMEASQIVKTYAVKVSVKKDDLNRSYGVSGDCRGGMNRTYAIANCKTLLLCHGHLASVVIFQERSKRRATGWIQRRA